MTFSAFPYIGGKTRLADWIIDHLPAHTTYVEPFGGSAAVLLNKPRSEVEVFNDLDDDVTHFFDVARTRTEELIEWCRLTPYSEELHRRWSEEFYEGHRPKDDIERAGRWLFLRYTQYAAKLSRKSGFKRDAPGDPNGGSESRNWSNVRERIRQVADRFDGVMVTNQDFAAAVDQYDTPSTAFYLDPPYVGKKDLYTERADHEAIADTLADIEGYALVSYTDLPDGLYQDWWSLERTAPHNAGATGKTATEHLLCNFDPEAVPQFVGAEQMRIDEVVGDD